MLGSESLPRDEVVVEASAREDAHLAGALVVLQALAGFEGAFENLEQRGALRRDARKAPHLISASIVERWTAWVSTRSEKS